MVTLRYLGLFLSVVCVASQTVRLAGDSTMAVGGGGSGTQGTHYRMSILLRWTFTLKVRLGRIPGTVLDYPCRQQCYWG